MKISGTCSWFGGPDDLAQGGIAPDEGLAFIYEIDDAPELFLPIQPAGSTGLAARLDPDKFYCAARWNYDVTSKEELLELRVIVRAPKTGKEFIARPADWGPHENTGRVADLSPGLMDALGIETDDEVEVLIPVPDEEEDRLTVAISVGHGEIVRGASGPPPYGLDEVESAKQVVAQVATYLRENGAQVFEFFDTTSQTQSENLETIVAWHNARSRELDVSVHFNCYNTEAHGVEVLYYSQQTIAKDISAAIAKAGKFTDRGAKQRQDLAFLRNTTAPSVLIETCFCDHEGDCTSYRANFEAICLAIAETIDGGGSA